MESQARAFASGHLPHDVRHKERTLTVPVVDRRVARTRTAILEAFRDLILSSGYEQLTVREIITRANVGRSTFYEHFDDKHDVLRDSIAIVLTPLAGVLDDRQPAESLNLALVHVWDSRRLSRSLLVGAMRPFATQLLAELIEEQLRGRMRVGEGGVPLIPLPLVAIQLAESQIGLIGAWLTDRAPCDAAQLAQAILRATRASADAILVRG